MYKVEKILQKRLANNKPEYLVKWEGWPLQQATWEPVKNLSLIKDLLNEFEKNQEAAKKTTSDSAKKRGRKRRAEECESGGEDRSKNKSSLKIRKTKAEKQGKKKDKNKEDEIEVLESEGEEKGEIEILGLKKEDDEISFYVKINGTDCWVERSFLVKNYADEICKFYEERIVFES